jgi:2-oxoglutarate dehydrogenase E1 component
MERFLQLAADTNVRIANCTTAAQYFHLLRRQAALLCTDPLPLIVFTPKSLLRHPLVASSTADLTHGGWRAVLDDEDANTRGNDVKRLVLCTGKVYVDLVSSARRAERPDVAIVRVEQLYPFPQAEVASTIARYPRVREIRWVQEEPENMGAWDFVRTRIDACAQGAPPVQVVARPRSASPADGSAARYATNQAALVEAAFGSSGGSPRRHAGTRKASPTSQASVASMASTTRAVKTKKTTTARAPKRPSAQTRSNRKPPRKT